MKPRFLLDENLELTVLQELQRRLPGIDILMVGRKGAPPKKTPDPDILIWIEENNYILVTRNRKSMRDHLIQHYETNRTIPGLFWVRRHAALGEILESLELVWLASEHEEYENGMGYIP